MISKLELRLTTVDQLEARITGLTQNLDTLDGLTTELEARQTDTDALSTRISGLTTSIENLSELTADLESRQASTDYLQAQVDSLTRDLQSANTVIAELESGRKTTEELEARVAKITQDLAPLMDLTARLESTGPSLLASENKPTSAKVARARTQQTTLTSTALPTADATAGAVAIVEPKSLAETTASSPEHTATVAAPNNTTSPPAASISAPDHHGSVEKLYQQSRQGRSWKINLISSPSREDALNFSKKAKSKGVNTQLEEVSVRGTPYWRVQITGFNSYDKALAHSEAVKNTLGLEETWIFRG
ncbi:MAG: SPOR domain-containing protein [Halioglobus sp.]|nr:SPOR domain-containing protein [Halioglobus sp.]